MNLPDDIAAWDSKDFTHINRVYAAHFDRPDFIPALITHCTSEPHQDGATWLLKHALDEGDLVPEAIDQDLLAEFCTNLPHLTRWSAQLHTLQILSVVPIPRPAAASVELFARSCMTSKKTFVRAWSYTALYAATLHDPKQHTAAVATLQEALDNPNQPASVKARIRNTLKSG